MSLALRIVVPVLNEGGELAPRLAALQPLRARGAELVVVDGGSTDESWLVACAYADRVLLAPRGRGAQLNRGASGCTADILLFLHADTCLPAAADTLVRSAVAAGAAWGWFATRIEGRHGVLRSTERLMNLRARLLGIATGDQALFVTRELFERAGGFPDQPLMEDIEMCKRLRRLGPRRVIRQPVHTSGRRWLASGPWRTMLLMWTLRARYFLGADPHKLAAHYGYQARPAPARAAVAVLAKAPVAGLAKTRLIPALGATGAARLQRRLAAATVRMCSQAATGPITLWCTPDTGHPFFRALQAVTGVILREQPSGDLGARLRAAMQAHFRQQPNMPLLMIGTDCPTLAPGQLQDAARALQHADVVLIPAEDGGYVLIGMRRAVPEAFVGIAWSTAAVMQQTRERLEACGVTWRELPTLWDVDEPRDWDRLQATLAGSTLSHP